LPDTNGGCRSIAGSITLPADHAVKIEVFIGLLSFNHGYYAKIKFCEAVLNLGLHFITKLRKDAHYTQPAPPKTGKKRRIKGDRILPQDLENTITLSDDIVLKY
jgi:hypothetical protein